MVNAPPDKIYEFIDKFTLREGAFEFYREIKSRNIPFYIVSDGTDLYLEHILNKYGLSEIKYFCNKGILKNNRLFLEFPYDNGNCHRCGSCKGERIREIVGDDADDWNVIFIGDGLSDICAVPRADIIFARGDLLQYCHEKDKTAVEYKDFFDILEYLNESGIIPAIE
jgi:2,3-diketo-5-methylthio-1-phosphopentane phosphatase